MSSSSPAPEYAAARSTDKAPARATAWLIFIWLGLVASPGAGVAAPLSYEEARVALHAVSDLQKSGEAGVGRSQYEARAADSLGLPEVFVNATQVFGVKSDSLGTPFGTLNFSTNFTGPRASINSTWSIYTGGRISATQRALAAGVDQASAELAGTEQHLDLELTQVYFAVALAANVERTRSAQLREADRHLERAIRFEERGVIAKVERLNAQVSRDRAARELVRAQSERKIAQARLLAAVPGWIANLLAATLRGAGNVRVPAIVTAVGALITLALSPLFILGWGWVPRMGVAGAGVALLCFNAGSAIVLAAYLRSKHSTVRLVRTRLEWRLFKDILRVGLLSAIGTVVANLTVVITTGLVGAYGRDAIAGYGLASRLDYLLIPLLFALGTASVTMVGINMGAGQAARARQVAWTGALLSTLATALIGLAAATFPEAWLHLFSRDPQVVAQGAAYLARVAPFYPLFGAGMSLYFASQGAGKMAWPFAAGIVRLALVSIGGAYWMHALGGSLNGLYWIAAASYVAFGGINVFGLASGRSWGLHYPVAGKRSPQAG